MHSSYIFARTESERPLEAAEYQDFQLFLLITFCKKKNCGQEDIRNGSETTWKWHQLVFRQVWKDFQSQNRPLTLDSYLGGRCSYALELVSFHFKFHIKSCFTIFINTQGKICLFKIPTSYSYNITIDKKGNSFFGILSKVNLYFYNVSLAITFITCNFFRMNKTSSAKTNKIFSNRIPKKM